MRKSLTKIVVSLFLVVLTAMSAMAAGDNSASAARGVVNINTADAAQLSFLPRIGPKAAERIVEYRKVNGSFKKTSDLMQVKGIGDKSYQMLSPYLTVEGKTTLSEKQHTGKGRPRASRSAKTATEASNTAH
ncbi:MAG TPA: helix-hairpin-helix domain-containing protein [Thermoanaerobaculia bacterium]|nr:helix-hairpin-helix domain-containing protein [Thermoanaerobaculia bacterium]